MLIRPNGRDKTNYTPGIKPIRSAVPDAPMLTLKTVPDGADGRRIPTPNELFDMFRDPKMGAALELLEKDMGSETAFRRMVRKQMVKDAVSDIAVRTQVKAIQLGAKKRKWKAEESKRP